MYGYVKNEDPTDFTVQLVYHQCDGAKMNRQSVWYFVIPSNQLMSDSWCFK